jgi:hypothetical protein
MSHGQIYEIIGDELWMDSEINCLCNVASDRKIRIPQALLQSKRESRQTSFIIIKTKGIRPQQMMKS